MNNIEIEGKCSSLKIIGAGMAGLLAGNILRRHHPVIVERQLSLPHNHSALLRFRSSSVSDATGVPFKKVLVRKGVWDGNNVRTVCTIPLANSYSQKVSDSVRARSIWNLEPEQRWIAPHSFVEDISQGLAIELNAPFSFIDHRGLPAISTLPMPILMKALDYHEIPDFIHRSVWTAKYQIVRPETEVFQTIYDADPSSPIYRSTIHGDELTLEFANQPSRELLASSPWLDTLIAQRYGIDSDLVQATSPCKEQPFGKIVPIDEKIRRAFICWLSEKHNIYSLGRFATWRPLLLDDLVNDIKVIERMLNNRYDQQLQAIKL